MGDRQNSLNYKKIIENGLISRILLLYFLIPAHGFLSIKRDWATLFVISIDPIKNRPY